MGKKLIIGYGNESSETILPTIFAFDKPYSFTTAQVLQIKVWTFLHYTTSYCNQQITSQFLKADIQFTTVQRATFL